MIERINNRITGEKEQVGELEDRMVEITAEKQNIGKRMKRIESSFINLWDSSK